jgi:hypothetical protein
VLLEKAISMPIVQIKQIQLKIQRQSNLLGIFKMLDSFFGIYLQIFALFWCTLCNNAPNKCLLSFLLPNKPKPPQYKA